jgi:hypothetical protein
MPGWCKRDVGRSNSQLATYLGWISFPQSCSASRQGAVRLGIAFYGGIWFCRGELLVLLIMFSNIIGTMRSHFSCPAIKRILLLWMILSVSWVCQSMIQTQPLMPLGPLLTLALLTRARKDRNGWGAYLRVGYLVCSPGLYLRIKLANCWTGQF